MKGAVYCMCGCRGGSDEPGEVLSLFGTKGGQQIDQRDRRKGLMVRNDKHAQTEECIRRHTGSQADRQTHTRLQAL